MSQNTNSCPYKPKKVLTEKQASKEKVGSFYHPTEKTYRTGACPIGSNLKKGYERKAYNKKNGTHIDKTYVDPVCVHDKGSPGKTMHQYKPITINKKSDLKPYGYSTSKNSNDRFRSLLEAIKILTYKTVILRLLALRTLTKKSNEKHSKIYNEDIMQLRAWREKNPNSYKGKSA